MGLASGKADPRKANTGKMASPAARARRGSKFSDGRTQDKESLSMMILAISGVDLENA